MGTKAGFSKDVDVYVAELEPPLQELANTLRQLVLDAAPGVEEQVKWGQPCYLKNGMICYLAAGKGYIRFGFWRGVDLKDLNGLLEGTGKGMRHVKVRSLDDIRADLFTAWVREAVELNAG